MFTKKHYIMLASIIKQNKVYFDDKNKYYLFCRAFGILLEDDNENFDSIKFLDSCLSGENYLFESTKKTIKRTKEKF